MSEGSKHARVIEVPGFAKPKGYANGVAVTGEVLFVAGQIGWDENQKPVEGGFVEQFARALDNVIAVVRAAGGEPSDVVEMTVFVTDLEAYRASVREIGPIWKARFGRHFPAMALVGVAGLVERWATVEITARAALVRG